MATLPPPGPPGPIGEAPVVIELLGVSLARKVVAVRGGEREAFGGDDIDRDHHTIV